MELFGIGPGELMLVLILALIVFGPAKLPEMARGLGRAIREFQKATSQITEELTRELQVDTPAKDGPRPQPSAPQEPVPQEPRREEPAAAAEAQNGPLVLEIKPPVSNGATAAHEEVPSTVQTTPAEAPVAEAPSAQVSPKPRRTRRTRKAVVEPEAEREPTSTEMASPAETTPSVEAAPPTRPRRRRKAAGSDL